VPALVAALALALALGACGGGGSGGASTPARPRTAVQAAAQPAVAPARPVRHVRGPHDAAVPILMYHVIHGAPAGTPYPDLWVAPQTFTAQLAGLARAGYHGVTLQQVWDYWHKAIALPAKPIVVSFDDGYLSAYQRARPALARLGWPGVLNLEVKNVGLAGGLSRHQVRGLVAAHWEIDAHTITHPDLTTVDAARLHTEVAGSRQRLRAMFGVPVRFFCYPSGRHDATVEAAVRQAGYAAATTVQPGLASPHQDPYALPRIRVLPRTTPAALLAEISAMRGARA
jgi:peptidoglycan/xylan/chitin deacetylase (PgdA/CDA1 family)